MVTDPQDKEGRDLETHAVGGWGPEDLERVLASFRGKIEQEVPAYSAVRVHGQRAYTLARAGLPVPRRVRQVTIDELKLLAVRLPDLDLRVTCSKGTYIRALCSDIGRALGCGGTMEWLRRTRIGPVHIERAVKPEEAGPEHVLPVEGVSSIPFLP
jgi:tRNA pseudouridine55 synthase